MNRSRSLDFARAALFGLSLCAAAGKCASMEIKRDKLKHLLVSLAIGAAGAAAARDHGARTCQAARIGIGVGLMFGAGKEYYDLRYKRTYWSWGDLFWDAVGATAGSMLTSGCR